MNESKSNTLPLLSTIVTIVLGFIFGMKAVLFFLCIAIILFVADLVQKSKKNPLKIQRSYTVNLACRNQCDLLQ